MSLKQELHALKQQRREELQTLHFTYVRTKRDIKRSLSPDRMIRKHMGVSLGIAAFAGLLLAPRLGGRRKTEDGKRSRFGGWARRLSRMFLPRGKPLAPESNAGEPEAKREEEMLTGGEAEPPRKRREGLLVKLLAAVMVALLRQLDLPRLMRDWIGNWGAGRRGDGHRSNGHGVPQSTVADAGTAHGDPFDDLQ